MANGSQRNGQNIQRRVDRWYNGPPVRMRLPSSKCCFTHRSERRVSSPQQLSVALSDLESLLIHGKPPIKKPATEVYDRTKYWTYASDPKEAFHKFYQYCFVLVKPPCVSVSRLPPQN